ncbi:hypothetical protein FRC01_006724, partial [Tulasnella sp. 417]
EIFDVCESPEDSPKTRTLSDTVAAEIAICEAVQVATRRKRNERTLFSHLPADIVHSIFGIVLDVDRIHDPKLPAKLVNEIPNQLDCMRLVSSAWNHFLLSSPRYWQAIDVGTPRKKITLALERSGAAPLHMYSSYGHLEESSIRLVPAARVKTLRSTDSGEYLLFRRFLQNPMPVLQTLELAAPSGMLGGDPREPFGNFPSLRHLSADRWQPPVHAAFLPNLKELLLYRQREPQIMEVPLVLSACINLEQLELSDAVQGELPGTIAPITLPHLQSITLEFRSSKSAVQFIRKLVIPQCLRRSIRVREAVDLDLYIADYRGFMCLEERRLGQQHPKSAAILLDGSDAWPRVEYLTGSSEVNFKVLELPETPAFRDLIQEFQTALGGPPLTVTIERAAELPTPLLLSLGGRNVQAIVIDWNYAPPWDLNVLKTIKVCLTDRPFLDEPMVNAATDRSFKSLRSIEIRNTQMSSQARRNATGSSGREAGENGDRSSAFSAVMKMETATAKAMKRAKEREEEGP